MFSVKYVRFRVTFKSSSCMTGMTVLSGDDDSRSWSKRFLQCQLAITPDRNPEVG